MSVINVVETKTIKCNSVKPANLQMLLAFYQLYSRTCQMTINPAKKNIAIQVEDKKSHFCCNSGHSIRKMAMKNIFKNTAL